MSRYGLPYQGSKNGIARRLIEQLPPARHFYDVFGGGGAMAHAAALSGKYQVIHYNEIDPAVCLAFRRAVAGDVPDPGRWVSREDFYRLKDSDPLIALCWSFGNNRRDYLYAREREPLAEALFRCRMHGDASGLARFGVSVEASDPAGVWQEVKRRAGEISGAYKAWYRREGPGVLAPAAVAAYEAAVAAYEAAAASCREYLVGALRASGRTRGDVDRHLGTNGMAGHYFGRSQWEMPTREVYAKMREILPGLDRDYDSMAGSLTRPLILRTREKSLETIGGDAFLSTADLSGLVRAFSGVDLDITCGDYRALRFERDAVIYCDPPYEGTDTKGYLVGGCFDTAAFLEWVRRGRRRVFLSEVNVQGAGWRLVWQRRKANLFTADSAGKSRGRWELLWEYLPPLERRQRQRQLELEFCYV